jgi:Lrp/AsnC family leucine-responsive transcriptional regulator
VPIDAIDRAILTVLFSDGRISYRSLAHQVRLSPNAAAERVRRLVSAGVITRFRADVAPAALGRSLLALVDIRLRPGVTMPEAEAELRSLPQLIHATHVTGRSDYVLQIACRDASELDVTIRALNDTVGAMETETRILLSEIRPDRPPF